MTWNVFVVDSEGNCDKINSVPYTLSNLAEFLTGLDVDIRSILLLPA